MDLGIDWLDIGIKCAIALIFFFVGNGTMFLLLCRSSVSRGLVIKKSYITRLADWFHHLIIEGGTG